MKFGFIGAGKVGVSLGKYLTENGRQVSGYFSQYEKDAREAAEFCGSKYYNSLEMLLKNSDIIFLTVPDDQIVTVWEQIKNCCQAVRDQYQDIGQSIIRGKIVCHCSGAMSSEVFSDITIYGAYGFSIHPLFAVSDKLHSYKELSNSYFTIEGSLQKIDFVKDIFDSMGNKVCIIDPDKKIKYHAAAAISSNLVAGLISASQELLKECGFDDESAHNALAPIIKGNIDHIVNDGVVNALTGPIERNDVGTVKKHLDTLESTIRDMYVTVSRQVIKIAKTKNMDRDYNEMEEKLK